LPRRISDTGLGRISSDAAIPYAFETKSEIDANSLVGELQSLAILHHIAVPKPRLIGIAVP